MPKYIDPSKIRLNAVGTVDDNGDILVSVRDVKKAIEQTPAADVMEIDVLRAWLYEIAINNVGQVIDGDFSTACEEIISRLDGLKMFAENL